jgi:flagellar hook-associated protein 1
MSSIFNSLNIGYSGLSASQVGINTTSHNISNAETDGYTRQRVVQSAAQPVTDFVGSVGNGVQVTDIKRVFDNFVFKRYTDLYSNKEYNQLEKDTLEQLSKQFPEIDQVGIKADLAEYYNMWQNLADNPENDSIKLALAKQTQTLSEHIQYTQGQVTSMQKSLNDQLLSNVNEVNSLGEKLAALNKAIDTAEAGGTYSANDLRDKRNVIERDLSRLIGSTVSQGNIQTNIQIDSKANTKTDSYSVSINGFNFVDGSSFHPIHISNENNTSGFYEISYERQDGVLVPLESKVSGGKIGALLNLRGGSINSTTGVPTDGVLQNTISELNAFASGLIESTNNLYASTPTTVMKSNSIDIKSDTPLTSSGLNIKNGSFDVVVYDVDGNEVATRRINIDVATTLGDSTSTAGSNSISGQLKDQIDDNADGNANNDINSLMDYNFLSYDNGNGVKLSLNSTATSKGYTFSIKDVNTNNTFSSGTNFAGAMGLGRFFDGNDATNIDVTSSIKENPSVMKAGLGPVSGDNRVALNMIQHQFEKYDFTIGTKTYNTTANGMFDIIATDVGTMANTASMQSETTNAQFNAVEMEYSSTSKVSIDEEMTNLIRYQTSYGASAKIITTIDQMMQTLLGIKQ